MVSLQVSPSVKSRRLFHMLKGAQRTLTTRSLLLANKLKRTNHVNKVDLGIELSMQFSRAKVLEVLEAHAELLKRMEQQEGEITAGPLSRLLIQGKLDMLKWYVTIETTLQKHSSLDTRIMMMLQKQKGLLSEPVNDRRPAPTSKVEIQGRIEILEWLLSN